MELLSYLLVGFVVGVVCAVPVTAFYNTNKNKATIELAKLTPKLQEELDRIKGQVNAVKDRVEDKFKR